MVLGSIAIWLMGRSLICPCGTVKLWFGERVSAENSQHICDLWTLTHFVGGAAFYFIAWLIAHRWLTVGRIALFTAVMIVAWEVAENTDFVIDRYRGAGAWDYYGDSVINAFADMVVGVIRSASSFRVRGRQRWGGLFAFRIAGQFRHGGAGMHRRLGCLT
jgi:hypothetical protein